MLNRGWLSVLRGARSSCQSTTLSLSLNQGIGLCFYRSPCTVRTYSGFQSDDAGVRGKSALVTGCTTGIGLGIAQSLASHGADVILNGFGDPDVIRQLQTDVTSRHGVKCYHLDADLSRGEDVDRLCQRSTEIFPEGVDILVNNAGLQHVCSVEDFPEEKWDLLIAVMLTAPFRLTKYFLPAMRRKKWGRIINVGSVHSLVASPNKSAYCSAKHGVVGLTKVVALETAGSGVTCNAVCPAFVNTQIFQKQILARSETDGISLEQAKERILEQVHPTKQVVEVEQVAEFVSFLCTRHTDQMTGSVLTMDAGWTAR